ncbi:MAG: hypothetical protein JXA22_10905 [Candidatus Thermoplasmatota archaeon]|nr:hypothetical protein [Candidatus Thermoplasmatota archaeon]
MRLKPDRRAPDLYTMVKETIKPVRKQGDPPEEDLENMDGFICDLCLVPIKRSEISQCPFCGRWICRDRCYSEDELCCKSCAGIIRLMRESVVLGELRAPPDTRNGKEDTLKKNR